MNDFTFSDLTRPTHDRLVKIFSYLINFVRFRESQTAVIDEHFNKAEQTKARIETLYADNQDVGDRVDELRRNQKALESQVKEKVQRNNSLKGRLLVLSQSQAKITEELERAKTDKAKRQAALEEKMEKAIRARQEIDKLKPYVQQSYASLQTSLTELSENLTREKGQVDTMERRLRALQTSIDTFNVVANEVQACVKVLEDISVELQKEEEEDARAARNKDAISERGNNVREVAQTEKLLQRQLARWNERIEALRKNSQEKQEVAQARMEELRSTQKQLREERAEKQKAMEIKRIRIEQTEKKVSPEPFLIACIYFFNSIR